MFTNWMREIRKSTDAVTPGQLQEMVPQGEIRAGDQVVMTELPKDMQALYCLMKIKTAEAVRLSANIAVYSDRKKIREITDECGFIQQEIEIIRSIFFLLLRRNCAAKIKELEMEHSPGTTIEVVKGWQVVARPFDERTAKRGLAGRFRHGFGVPVDAEMFEELSELGIFADG